jgi:hypothetical protein
MPTTADTVQSPAAAILKLQAKNKKDKAYAWTPSEVRALAEQAIAYLETRIEAVEAIAGGVSVEEGQRLAEKVARLEAKENKSDDDYLQLALSERKLKDVSQREIASTNRAVLSNKMLAEELALWGLIIIQHLAAANAKNLFEELERLLRPHFLDRPAREVIDQIPSYHQAVYFTLWHRPSQADLMMGSVDGVASARALVTAIHEQLKQPVFAKIKERKV